MAKCPDCIRVIDAMNHLSPVGWIPFAWGPANEEPCHFHVFPDSEVDRGDKGPEEVSARPICQVENPVARANNADCQ